MPNIRRIILSVVILTFCTTAYAVKTELPALNALPNASSISGLSSGAFMAAQFHVAYSKDMMGAGIVAGGPWNCAGTNPYISPLISAVSTCMNPCKYSLVGCPSLMYPNVGYLADLAKLKAKGGDIDPVDNLKNDHIYIFSGKSDQVVVTGVVNTTVEFYKKLGVADNHLLYDHDVNAGHAFITINQQDTRCDVTAAPYINYCPNTPQAQQIFKEIYGTIKPAAKKPSGELLEFDQSEFFDSPLTSMDDNAYVYIPKGCRSHQCRVHIAMHGCEQGISVIGTKYITETGYMEVADTNNTIVLFPQVKASTLNPKDCWDFWGYTTSNLPPYTYYTKQAPQMMAIKKMLDRLISQPMTHAKTKS